MARQASHDTQPVTGSLSHSLTILRTDTVFAKLPIHNLAKGRLLQIQIAQSNEEGLQDLYWHVSPSTTHGPPQQLAYKLDKILIDRHLDALKRPLPTIVRLGSLRDICDQLDLRIGKSVAEIKNALHQNAGAYITAKVSYRDTEGNQRRLEAGFNRYGVVFTGESLPDGTTADAVYITLNESYRQVLNSAPMRPIDYDYLSGLKPLTQRFYELLSFKMFATLKFHHPRVTMRYSELCLFAPQHRSSDRIRMMKQMTRIHEPHLQSGYLAAVQIERVLDSDGHSDWFLHYTPGPKAQAEYEVFTGQHRKLRPSLQVAVGTNEPKTAVSDRLKIEALNPARVDSRTDPQTVLIQQFHRTIHGVEDKIPHPKEIERATRLIEQHGQGFSTFFVDFACKAARQDGYQVQVFGGVMRYEGAALAAYRSRQARQAKASAEQTEARKMELRQVYERDCRGKLAAYEADLDQKTLAGLKEEIRTELIARKDIPPAALRLALRLELDERLSTLAGLPSFEAWLSGQNATARAIHHENAQPIVGVLGKEGK